jgi:hypothetical protein
VGRSTEVISVLGFTQPAALALRFAHLMTSGFRAEFLTLNYAGIRMEIFFAVLALTCSFPLHRARPNITKLRAMIKEA